MDIMVVCSPTPHSGEYLVLLFKVGGKAELLCRHVAAGMFISVLP